jgi:hypothetical protein
MIIGTFDARHFVCFVSQLIANLYKKQGSFLVLKRLIFFSRIIDL